MKCQFCGEKEAQVHRFEDGIDAWACRECDAQQTAAELATPADYAAWRDLEPVTIPPEPS